MACLFHFLQFSWRVTFVLFLIPSACVFGKISISSSQVKLWEPLPKPFTELGFQRKENPQTQLILLERKTDPSALEAIKKDKDFEKKFAYGVRSQLQKKGFSEIQLKDIRKTQKKGLTEVYFKTKYKDLQGRPAESYERHGFHAKGSFSATLIQLPQKGKVTLDPTSAQREVESLQVKYE
jgi:hypothetical protein